MIGKRSSSEAPDEWAGGHSRFPACWRRCADCGGHQTAIGPLKSGAAGRSLLALGFYTGDVDGKCDPLSSGALAN